MVKLRNVSRTHYLIAFTGFGSFRNNFKYVYTNWRHIERPYFSRAALTSICHTLTALAGFPLRRLEDLAFNARLRTLELPESPIFVIGHWRSGTTYLHNLLCQDTNFGYVSLFQTLANDLCIVGSSVIKPVLEKVIPKVRPTDNVPFNLDQPQEDEHVVARISPYSFYHLCCFPKLARKYFEKYVLFQETSVDEIEAWKQTYLAVLKKATLNMGNRQLVLKNPVNTGRIRQLLEIFPDAKFVHIYRNPYDVFLSTRNQYLTTLEITRLQTITRKEVDGNIILFYKQIMQQFLKDRVLIPENNLVEIRFEDFEASPLSALEMIYDRLSLPGFAKAVNRFNKFTTSQANYKKNQYDLTDDVVQTVNDNWAFAFDTWRYRMKSHGSLKNHTPTRTGNNLLSHYKRKSIESSSRNPARKRQCEALRGLTR